MPLRTKAAAAILLTLALTLTLPAQERGTWHPASKTAQSITGDITLPKKPVTTEPQIARPGTAEWFAELGRLNELADEPFMANGREQPEMPADRKIFD